MSGARCGGRGPVRGPNHPCIQCTRPTSPRNRQGEVVLACVVVGCGVLLQGGGPVGEQLEVFVGCGAGFGGVAGHGQAAVGGDFHRVEGEVESAVGGGTEMLDAGAVQPYVVRGPPGAKRLAAGGQLTDEVGQAAIVRVTAGFGAQQRDGYVGGVVPVGVEV